MSYDNWKLQSPAETGIHLRFVNGKLEEIAERDKRPRIKATRCICCGKIMKGYCAPKCTNCKK